VEKSLVFADPPIAERISLCDEPCFVPFLPLSAAGRRNGRSSIFFVSTAEGYHFALTVMNFSLPTPSTFSEMPDRRLPEKRFPHADIQRYRSTDNKIIAVSAIASRARSAAKR
jgi:hypothetical protein